MSDTSPSDTAWLSRYDHLSLDEALTLAESEGRPTRVLRPGDVITLDWRPDRLNLHLDEHGGLVEARAG